jgi:hypothetical protein
VSDKELKWCPGCDRELPEPAGENMGLWCSLDGWDYEICRECWAGLRPFERILLRLLSGKDEDDIQTGAAFHLSVLFDMARKAFRAGHGHDADSVCSQCDPQRWREQQERRQRRAAEKAARLTPPP